MERSFYIEKAADDTDWLLVGLLIGGICLLILLVAACAIYQNKGPHSSSGLYFLNLFIKVSGSLAVVVQCTIHVSLFVHYFNTSLCDSPI